VAEVATGIQLNLNVRGHRSAFHGGHEAMLRVVAMGILGEAVGAKIKVLTGRAVEEVRLGQLCHPC